MSSIPTQSLSAIDDASVSVSEICDSEMPISRAFALSLSLATALNAGATCCAGACCSGVYALSIDNPNFALNSSGVIPNLDARTTAISR